MASNAREIAGLSAIRATRGSAECTVPSSHDGATPVRSMRYRKPLGAPRRLRAEGTTGVVVLAPEAANACVGGVLVAPSTALQHASASQQPTSAVATPCGFPMKKR